MTHDSIHQSPPSPPPRRFSCSIFFTNRCTSNIARRISSRSFFSAVVAYAASLLLSFIFWGYRLHTYTVAIANGDKLVQESEKIISFLKALSTSVAILVAISIIYAIYPYYTMKTALSFMLVSITALFRMMHCASRCIRVPPVEYSTTEFHQCWCSSCLKKKGSFNRRCNQNSLQEQAENNEKWLSRVNPRSLQPTSKTETTFIAPALLNEVPAS